jgi:hypothetical protein
MSALLRPSEPRPPKRSPFLIAAYCTMGGALILLLLGAGAFWILASSALAVLLAVADLFLKVRRL